MNDANQDDEDEFDEPLPGLITRILVLEGEETELSLESAFWDALMMIADEVGKSVAALIEEINDTSDAYPLSSAVRLFAFDYYRRRRV